METVPETKMCRKCSELKPVESYEIDSRCGQKRRVWCYACCHPVKRGRPIADRLWERVDKNGPIPAHRPELGQCWPWTGSVEAKGYGTIKVAGKIQKAHRVAYVLTYGNISDDKPMVCHHCDNPPCCRPDHLFAGTCQDNAKDMAAKGRAAAQTHPGMTAGDKNGSRQRPECRARGAAHGSHTHPEARPVGSHHGRSKLVESQVIEIRQSVASGEHRTAVATRFGVCRQMIDQIVTRQNWKHVP
jgi:hypothetical protein